MFPDLGALLMHLGSTDPQQARQLAAQLDAQGIPIPQGITHMMPGGASMLGGPTDPNTTPQTGQPPMDLGALISGGVNGGAGAEPSQETNQTPQPQAAAAGPSAGQQALGALGAGATKLAAPNPMPGAPTGVTGGVKPPDHPAINPAIISGIMQMLQHPHAPVNTAPSLGQLIK